MLGIWPGSRLDVHYRSSRNMALTPGVPSAVGRWPKGLGRLLLHPTPDASVGQPAPAARHPSSLHPRSVEGQVPLDVAALQLDGYRVDADRRRRRRAAAWWRPGARYRRR
jgi:hypothetical protein